MNAAAETKYHPSSAYFDDAYYDWLSMVSEDLAATHIRGANQATGELWRRLSGFLAQEARLLDQKALTAWLSLLDEHCAYWIPSDMPASDPRTQVTLELHDHRRLLDRAARLETGYAYSQYPASRTSRLFSGLEIWPSEDRKNEWRARYNFSLNEFRNGFSRTLAGWNGFVLRESGDDFRIVLKQINLIDCDRPQGNNSFFL
jgi:3-phenylpropionate/cinnamic acid dioxygenase small subunit